MPCLDDYYTIQDYVDKMKEIDGLEIDKLLNLSVLWNSERQRVNKGTYYIFKHKTYLYNILINDEVIAIDERHFITILFTKCVTLIKRRYYYPHLQIGKSSFKEM